MKRFKPLVFVSAVILSLVSAGCNVSVEMPFTDTDLEVLPDNTDGTSGKSAQYVYFGDWPQTIKAASVTVDETKSIKKGANTYYYGSDGAWYAKCMENAAKSGYKYSDGTDVLQKTEDSFKYFKVEPIKWRVLTDNFNGKKLLLAENVLAVVRYDIISNNYKVSEIREYLNETFLQTAFTESAQEKIAVTLVDNSAASTNPASNPTEWKDGVNTNACEDTNDRIFLPSIKEMTTSSYGFDEYNVYKGDSNETETSTRIRMATDYVKANCVYLYDGDESAECYWWLRSPHYGWPASVRVVASNGYLTTSDDYMAYSTCYGVCPAMCVSF